jgi:hypothetical protein
MKKLRNIVRSSAPMLFVEEVLHAPRPLVTQGARVDQEPRNRNCFLHPLPVPALQRPNFLHPTLERRLK